jgi:hypothetical protein
MTVNFADIFGPLSDLWLAHEAWTSKKKIHLFNLKALKIEAKDCQDLFIAIIRTSETPQLCAELMSGD